MFSRRNNQIAALEERIGRLEETSAVLTRSILTPQTPVFLEDDSLLEDEEKKLRAAYALNLCTVSISQIVDYNDPYILEQEYDGILNNLNLENFPHDDALLDILKRLLDTITFFRIQDREKQFIEEGYKQKMKTAIWSSVPNLSVILATGNPIAMVGALVSQVGIGYMNYRKEKARINLEHEKELWQLQRSAIEQINALRRELFATAWKLADRYEFKDSYRLTEQQISQYNQILMDPDPFRRYERLKNISGSFYAYPNFHFYIGDAANDIANDKNRPENIQEHYKEMAIVHLRYFNRLTNKSLLRIDPINAASCLELAGLLNPITDKDEIRNCLTTAAEKAGNALDVIQLCALGFLRIDETGEAEKLFRRLSVEGYNLDVNATLLSMLYFRDYTSTKDLSQKKDIHTQHETLSWIAPSSVLLPLPDNDSKEAEDSAKNAFLTEKMVVLNQATGDLVDKLISKNTVEINKKYLNPHPDDDMPDQYFMNSDEWEDDMNKIFDKKNKKKEFLINLVSMEQSLFDSVLDRINVIDKELQALPFFRTLDTTFLSDIPSTTNTSSDKGVKRNDASIIDERILSAHRKADLVEGKILQLDYEDVSFDDIIEMSLSRVLDPYYALVVVLGSYDYLQEKIKENNAMELLTEYERTLLDICAQENIEVSLKKKLDISLSDTLPTTYRRLGTSLYDNKGPKIKKCILDWFDNLDENKKKRIRLYVSGTEAFVDRWNSFTKEGLKIDPPFGINSLHAIMLRNDNMAHSELYLTTNALYYRKDQGLFSKDILVSLPYSEFKNLVEFIPKEYYTLYNEVTANELFKDIAKILRTS